jgi:hypothetical protein
MIILTVFYYLNYNEREGALYEKEYYSCIAKAIAYKTCE